MKADKLAEKLALVKPGLAGKEQLEQSTSFAFVDGYVCTYNDEVSVRAPLPEVDFQGVVEASKLYAFLMKMGNETIVFKARDNKLLVKASKAKAHFTFSEEVLLPIDFEFTEEWVVVKDVENFKKALKFCGISTAKDYTYPILTNVAVLKKGVIQSSDSFRITSVVTKAVFDKDYLLPYTSVLPLLFYDFVEYQVTDGNWIHFRTKDGVIFSIRLHAGTWVDTSKYLSLKSSEEIHLPKGLKDAIERAFVFVSGALKSAQFVKLEFRENYVYVRAFDETSDFEERVPLKESFDEPFTIAVNPTFLLDVLKEDAVFNVVDDGSTFVRFTGEGWQHMISLIKTVE